MPWYGIDLGDLEGLPGADLARAFIPNATFSAFEALDILDIILLLVAIGAGALIVLVALGKLEDSLKTFVMPIGAIAAVIVLFRIVVQPDGMNIKWGIFVALLGAGAIAAGPLLSRAGKI